MPTIKRKEIYMNTPTSTLKNGIVFIAVVTCSAQAFAAPVKQKSDTSIIKSTALFCGALSCRTYSLEKASISGTIIHITSCVMKDSDGNAVDQPCSVEI